MFKLFIVFCVRVDGLCASDWESWVKSLRVLIAVWEFFDTPLVMPELDFHEAFVTVLPLICILCWAGQSVYPLDYVLDL
jgi:hypothetical protein